MSAVVIPFSSLSNIVPQREAMLYCTCAETNQDKYLNKIAEWAKYVCVNVDADFYVFVDGSILPENRKRLPDNITFIEILPRLGRHSIKAFPGWKRSLAAALLLSKNYRYFSHIENDCFVKDIENFNTNLHIDDVVAVGWSNNFNFVEFSAVIINNPAIRDRIYEYYADSKHQQEQINFEDQVMPLLGNFKILGRSVRLEQGRTDNFGYDLVAQCTPHDLAHLANSRRLSPCFNHSGKIGDMLYSLNYALEYSRRIRAERFSINLQTDKYDGADLRLPMGAIKWVTPLLEYQPYIESVTASCRPAVDAINLDLFRSCGLNTSCSDIRYWYYKITPNVLPKDFYTPILKAPVDPKYHDRIIVARTSRHREPGVNYKKLAPLADQILFVGLDSEYKDFCDNQFKCERKLVENALEAATVINSAKAFISNQCGLFAIAEQLKVPRLLEAAEHKPGTAPNVLPLGGKCMSLMASPTVADILEVTQK